MTTTEQRSYCAEVRLDKQTESGQARICGTAAVFWDGTPRTQFPLGDRIFERIMPGAFDRALIDNDDVRALRDHNSSLLLGRTKSGTCQLWVDERGLHYSVTPADTELYRDTVSAIQRGDLDGSSFQFIVEEETEGRDGPQAIREIRSVRLYDVGPVTFPAYPASTADVRAIEKRMLTAKVETPEPAPVSAGPIDWWKYESKMMDAERSFEMQSRGNRFGEKKKLKRSLF